MIAISISVLSVILFTTAIDTKRKAGALPVVPAVVSSRFEIIEDHLTDMHGSWELIRDTKTGRLYFHSGYGGFTELEQEPLVEK